MAELGYHLGRETTTVINPHMQREYPSNSSKYTTNLGDRIKLMFDDLVATKTINKRNSYGVYVANGILYIDGEAVAKDTDVIQSSTFGLSVDGEDMFFGKVKLTPTQGEVINITKEDYCTLLAGDIPDGYTAFKPENVYNIVEDVATAEVVTWNNVDNLKYVIYNNIVGVKDTEGNNIVHDFTDLHFLSTDTPQLSVHDYKFRILEGERLKFMVMVDTKYLDKLNNNRIDDTFTIIVKNPYDKVLFTRTVYAGEIYVELSPFVDDNDDTYTGQTWFSVECIDSHGRGSAIRYYDLLILEDVEESVYHITTEDLSTFGITVNDNFDGVTKEMAAYNNKLGFTALFKHYADLGYTKLVFPKNVDDENETDPYSEEEETSANTDIYYVNYHALVDDSPGATKPFGDYEFWIYYIPSGMTSLDHPYVQKIKLTPNLPVQYPIGASEPEGTERVDNDPLNFVKRDGAHAYRVTADDVAQFLKIDMYGTSQYSTSNNDVNKIWVKWRNKFIYDDVINGKTVWNIAREDQVDTLHLQLLSAYDDTKMLYVGQTGKRYLRTYNVDKLPTYTNDSGTTYYTAGTYYVVKRTAISGDNIEFPDNVTIDFNGATFKAIHCHDTNDNDLYYMDINKGRIIQLDENFNTHLKNLTVDGVFYELDFVSTYLLLGREDGGICEAMNNIDTAGSRFCSYENVRSIHAMCYDAKNTAKTAANRRYPPTNKRFLTPAGVDSMFAKLGYIDFNGNVVNCTTPIRKLAFTSSYGTHENLVYDEKYRTCNVVYDCTRKKDGQGNFVQVQSDDFAIGAYKYPNGNGKHPEVFIAFYNIQNEDITNPDNIRFIKLIKTRFWVRIKIPIGATHYRVVGYGISKVENNQRISAVITSLVVGKESTIDVVKPDGNIIKRTRTNAAFPAADLGDWTFTEHSRCIEYINCYTKESRSSAFSCETVNGVLYDGCTYEDIAFLSNTDWDITKELGGFEDGGYKTTCVTIKNCKVIQSKEYWSFEEHVREQGLSYALNKLRYSENCFQPLRCRDFTMMNNEGYYMGTSAAISDGYIVDNIFARYRPMRDLPIPYRHMIYRNNIIYDCILIAGYYAPEGYFKDPVNLYPNDPENKNNKGYRTYNCDDIPSYKVVMFDSIIAKAMPMTNVAWPNRYVRRYVRTKIKDNVT